MHYPCSNRRQCPLMLYILNLIATLIHVYQKWSTISHTSSVGLMLAPISGALTLARTCQLRSINRHVKHVCSTPHLVAVGSGQVTNLCNPLSFALMLVFSVLHHPFIWQYYHCLTFIKFLILFPLLSLGALPSLRGRV
jgi:hypothetical protein